MSKRVAVTNLNASTLDIINTIRANASYEYQNLVPEISDVKEIPRVGEVLYGYPALANQFINALVNRIALVKVKSATFNNDYAELKKGYLEFGETVEEVFVNIAKAREFSVEKAAAREFKRTLPDVRSAFHCMNWRAQYPVTIQDEDLRMAFQSADGVQDLIARIVDSVYTAEQYDEFLLFKYLMIKAIAHGKMYPVSIGSGDMKEAGSVFRGISNKITFMSTKYNADGVTTTTPKEDQYIFMDSMYNAQYDVEVLASAFNMDKAEYMGKLKLIDDWTTFDNERFAEIIDNTDMIEPITAEELALMSDVKAVLVDREWFQVYDNNLKFTEDYVASGMYWNYFLNSWKTVSSSPFSNAIVFVTEGASELPNTVTVTVDGKTTGDNATALTLSVADSTSLDHNVVTFIQNESATTNGIAIHKYGAVLIPEGNDTELTMTLAIDGTVYTAGTTISAETEVGTTITFSK
jgi:hypothetical protein